MENFLKVPSADGMELHLEIAELGSRSYAFIIDWHFRLLLSLTWLFGTWVWMSSFCPQCCFTSSIIPSLKL